LREREIEGAVLAKKKVVIIGGGIGGLVAAYQLSQTEQQREKLEITVHQMGWRLGGKCATGRDEAIAHRIEEHGIHGFLGSYFNALTLMKQVYAEWVPQRDSPIKSFEDAFPIENSAFFWEWEDNRLLRWPNRRSNPTSTIDKAAEFGTLLSWLIPAAAKLRYLAKALSGPAFGGADTDSESHDPLLEVFDKIVEALDRNISMLDGGFGAAEANAVPSIFDPTLNAIIDGPPPPVDLSDTTRRRIFRIFEFLAVLLRGVRDDQLLTKGLRSIDSLDFKDWLLRHKASEGLMRSPIVLATINTTYQYPEGDLARPPEMSAASYLQWTLRAFVDLGGAYYLFAAGSGDTIISPMYQVLRKRGVKFEFFSRLESLSLSSDARTVETIDIGRQAQVLSGHYKPLMSFKGLCVWPNRPDLAQLEHGSDYSNFDFEDPFSVSPHNRVQRLTIGEDFDTVILALPPKALALCAKQLFERLPKWKASLDASRATATQSLQIWLKKPVKEIDGRDLPGDFHLAGNYATGLHGHVDFGKFLKFEGWPEEGPEGLMFFSGVMKHEPIHDGPDGQAFADTIVRHTAHQMLVSQGARLLPLAGLNENLGASSPFAVNFDILYCLNPTPPGAARLDAQFFKANARPSELYTQAPPGTRETRITPLDTGVTNLTCAGDWVDTVLNVGSFEGATIGGMLAACAVDEKLSPSQIIGIRPTAADFVE
jgi:uncharacterized protein with NAD-binding domain and iron-sulfur cluster